MDIPILFRDSAVAVCVKPPGADAEKDMPALLEAQLKVPEVLCVHRLDRDVGGGMVYAKNRQAAAKLSGDNWRNKAEKTYLARCEGRLTAEDAEAFRQGVTLSDFVARPAEMRIIEANHAHHLNESCASSKIIMHINEHRDAR